MIRSCLVHPKQETLPRFGAGWRTGFDCKSCKDGHRLQTAKAIALECGVLDSNADATEPNLIEGRTFRNRTETERLEVVDRISVMGRSSPNDKLLLVQALRKRGHVVAVTRDGTNDAPAHEADIGLAMGIQGTEVAKESSDIIILDDNFASVVKVVRWGRSVYANIQKFIQFQLIVNVAALVINVVAAVSAATLGKLNHGHIRSSCASHGASYRSSHAQASVGRSWPLAIIRKLIPKPKNSSG